MRASYFTALFFSFIAVVLLIFVNIGITFNSPFLIDLYFVKATKSDNSVSIRYGPYNSCIMNTNVTGYNCTTPSLMYDLDLDGLVEVTGAESVQMLQFQMDMSKQLALHKTSVIVLPIAIFAIITFLLSLFTSKYSETVPCCGGFLALVGFVCSACGLAFIIFTYMTLFQSFNTLFKLTYSWGPSIYLLGVSSLILFLCFIGFAAHCWNDSKYKQKAMEALKRQRILRARARRRRRMYEQEQKQIQLQQHIQLQLQQEQEQLQQQQNHSQFLHQQYYSQPPPLPPHNI